MKVLEERDLSVFEFATSARSTFDKTLLLLLFLLTHHQARSWPSIFEERQEDKLQGSFLE